MKSLSSRATLKTVAEAAGVGINAVSEILNRGRSFIYDPRTVARVRKAAEEQDYRPNRAAQALRTQSSRLIGFATWNLGLENTIVNPLVYPFLVGTSHALVERGFHVALVELGELSAKKDAVPRALENHSFDGLILHEGIWSDLSWRSLVKTPLLWWDSGVFEAHNCLYRDEHTVGKTVTENLIRLGHRRVCFEWNPRNHEQYFEEAYRDSGSGDAARGSSFQTPIRQDAMPLHFSISQRYQGYLEAMAAAGLEPRSLISTTRKQIARSMEEMKPTAVILPGGDRWSLLQIAASECGWTVPKDISIASCDIESRVTYELSSMTGGLLYDRYMAGHRAGEMMLQMLDSPTRQVPSETFTGKFRKGDTIAKASP